MKDCNKWENSSGNITEITVVLDTDSIFLLHSPKVKFALGCLLSVTLKCYGRVQKSLLVAPGFPCSNISKAKDFLELAPHFFAASFTSGFGEWWGLICTSWKETTGMSEK